MADYKLRLDVDAKLLEQALEKAVKKAFGKIPSMSGGGIGGGFGGVGSSSEAQKFKFKEKTWKQSKKLTIEEHKLRNKNLYDMKHAYIREKAALRAHNIMLEKSGAQAQRTFRMLGQLVGGRPGGTAGQVVDMGLQGLSRARSGRKQRQDTKQKYDKMDYLGRTAYDKEHGGPPETGGGGFNKVMDKFDKVKSGPIGQFMKKNKDAFNKRAPKTGKALGVAGKAAGVMGKGGTQLVKLAGIGAALAGGAGLGKMIVDSSPMLKAMLKLLNVGVMLILRPIGDFIGFMLRPLLLHFVTKVAIPAYKNGSKLAKEWGDKAGKVLLDLFTDPETFMLKAIINPLKGEGEKTMNAIAAQFEKLAVVMMYLLNPAKQKTEFERIDAALDAKNKLVDAKYPGYGDMGQLKQLMDMTEETTTQTENVKNANEAIHPWLIHTCTSSQTTADNTTDIKDGVDQLVINTDAMITQGTLAWENAINPNKPIPVVPVNADGLTQDEVMDDQRKFFEENPYTPIIPVLKEVMGTQAIEKAAEDKKLEAIALANEKRNMTESGHIIIANLSKEAQEMIRAAAEFKTGRISDGKGGWIANSPVVGSRCGMVGPMATGDMGQHYVTSERSRGLDSGDHLGRALGEECYTPEQFTQEAISLGVDTREAAEMYTEAIQAAAKSGDAVWIEYQRMQEAATKQETITTEITREVFAQLDEVKDQTSIQRDVTDQYEDIDGLVEEQKVSTCHSTEMTKEIMWMIAKAHGYVRSLMRSLGLSGPNPYDIGPAPTTPKEEEEEKEEEPERKGNSNAPKYKINFEDGSSVERNLDSRQYGVYYKHMRDGTEHPSHPDMIISGVKRMARGGIIGEKIFGIGESGQQYMFGESGPETVTPGVGGTVNNGGGSTFNITINASNTGDIERQLKPAILRMLKESTARAGIV